MSSISFVNQAEVVGGIKRKLEDIQKAQMIAAKRMGIIAKQVIQAEVPPHIITSHWQKSINYHVARISDLEVEMTVGSNGAERYYYLQESINHPIAIGWHKVQPQMTDIYQKVITEGLLGRSVTQSVSGSGGMGGQESGFDEFSMMGGM
jgi:hypothetical protein